MWSGGKNSGATKKELSEEEEDTSLRAAGLSTFLKPTFGPKTSKHVSNNLEVFLNAIENPPQVFPTPMF